MTNTMTLPTRPNVSRKMAKPSGKICLGKSEIADLSQAEIRHMSSEDLIALILVADVSMLHGYIAEHLWYSDRANLEKLAFFAQRTVQNQGF